MMSFCGGRFGCGAVVGPIGFGGGVVVFEGGGFVGRIAEAGAFEAGFLGDGGEAVVVVVGGAAVFGEAFQGPSFASSDHHVLFMRY